MTLDPVPVDALVAAIRPAVIASSVRRRIEEAARRSLADEVIRHKVIALPAKGRHAKRAEARGEQPRSTSTAAAAPAPATETSDDTEPEASPAPA